MFSGRVGQKSRDHPRGPWRPYNTFVVAWVLRLKSRPYLKNRGQLKSPVLSVIGRRSLGFLDIVIASVGIDLKELGGQMSKCLKFCPGIEILNRFSLKNERL